MAMKKSSLEEVDMSSVGWKELMSQFQYIASLLSQAADKDDVKMADLNKMLADFEVFLVKNTTATREQARALAKEIKKESETLIKSSTKVSQDAQQALIGQHFNAALRNKDFAISKSAIKRDVNLADINKIFGKNIVKQEESKHLKSLNDRVKYMFDWFKEDRANEPKKRRRFIDDLVDAVGKNKTIMGTILDVVKFITLLGASWTRQFGTLGKVISAALVVAGPSIIMMLGKTILTVFGKALTTGALALVKLLARTPIPVIPLGSLFGLGGKGVKGAKAAQTTAKTTQTAKAAGGAGKVLAGMGTIYTADAVMTGFGTAGTVPKAAKGLGNLGGTISGFGAMGTANAKVVEEGSKISKMAKPALEKGAKAAAPILEKGGAKLGGRLAGRVAGVVPGAAAVAGGAMTALSGKWAYDAFKEGDIVGGAAFGVSTIASLVQMLAGNIPGIGTAVSTIAGVIGFIADIIGLFHKEIGEWISGFWDKFNATLFSGFGHLGTMIKDGISDIGKNIGDFITNSGVFGQPASAYPTPTVDPSRVDSTVKASVSSTNAAMIWDYFKKRGFSDEGIAGLMGNLQAESGLEFGRLQGDYTKDRASSKLYTSGVNKDSIPFVKKNNIGYGLAQWTSADRKRDLQKLAKARGVSIDDPQLQLDFLYYELEKYGLTRQLKNAKSVQGASNLILTRFEKPADQGVRAQVTRGQMGQKLYNQFAGTPVASSQSSDLSIKKEELQKQEQKEEKQETNVKVSEEQVKPEQIAQGQFPQEATNPQSVPAIDYSGAQTASNLLRSINSLTILGADPAYSSIPV